MTFNFKYFRAEALFSQISFFEHPNLILLFLSLPCSIIKILIKFIYEYLLNEVNVFQQNISINNFKDVKVSTSGVSSGIRFNFPSLRLLHLIEIFHQPLYQRSVDHLRPNRKGDTKIWFDNKSNKLPIECARKSPNLCTLMSYGVTDPFIRAFRLSSTLKIQN